MSENHVAVLRELSAKWRSRSEPYGYSSSALVLLQRKCADELDAAITALESSRVREDWVLVPAQMQLSPEDLDLIVLQCGGIDRDADDADERWSGGTLWVGEIVGDDGEKTHGLHIANAEYPEEGSVTLVEFAPTPSPEAAGEEQTRCAHCPGESCDGKCPGGTSPGDAAREVDSTVAAFERWARPRFQQPEVFDRIEGRPANDLGLTWEYNGNAVQACWAAWIEASANHPGPAPQEGGREGHKEGREDPWIRAWRNRFIDERTSKYQREDGQSYEEARANAEYDANQFAKSFASALAAHQQRGE